MSGGEIDETNHELTMISGAVIEKDYLYIAQYLDKFQDYWDEIEYSRLSSVDLSNHAAPWMAIDVNFKAVSVCVWHSHPIGRRLYVALGNEGEIKMVGPSRRPDIDETISGAGLSKSWSAGHGYLNSIREIGTSLYCCGGARQIYRRREPGGWEPIHGPILADARVGGGVDMNLIRHLHDINGPSETDIYAVGLGGDILHYDGRFWTTLRSPVDTDLFRIDARDPGEILIVGRNGSVLHGNARTGFSAWKTELPYHLTDVARFGNRIFLASHRGLCTLDPATGRMSPYATDLSPDLVDCHRLDARDGVLWSIGFKDLAFFDGSRWTRVPHPDNSPIR